MTTYNSTDNNDKWQHEMASSNVHVHADTFYASGAPSSTVAPSSQPSNPTARLTWKQRMANLCSRKFLTILVLGQLLSLCITATTIFTTKLAQGETPVSIPTTQSFLNYFVLGVVYTSVTIYKEGFRGWIDIMRRRAFYCKLVGLVSVCLYCLCVCVTQFPHGAKQIMLVSHSVSLDMLFAIIDVEGNYFVVKAYNYTSLLSAMLLDAWTIPCVVLLSVFFLKMRFMRYHYLGVFVAMVGMGFLIWSDMEAGKNFPGSDYIKGDLFCILGATLYAVSNVYQEFLVRQTPMYEVVGQLGFWATILNGIQLAVLERNELKTIEWTPAVVGYIIGFDIALFIMYSVSPILFRLSSATFFNLSLLTSDFYGLVFGIFLFGAQVKQRRQGTICP